MPPPVPEAALEAAVEADAEAAAAAAAAATAAATVPGYGGGGFILLSSRGALNTTVSPSASCGVERVVLIFSRCSCSPPTALSTTKSTGG